MQRRQRSRPAHRAAQFTRRGWGASSDTGGGYDTATQAKDALAVLDHAGIGKAVFVGRIPANQDMAWMISNFGDMTFDSDLFDVAIVLDAQGRPMMAYADIARELPVVFPVHPRSRAHWLVFSAGQE